MRPKTNDDYQRISLSLDARLLQRLHAWRASQLVEPLLTASIRKMIAIGLDHVGEPPDKPPTARRGKRGIMPDVPAPGAVPRASAPVRMLLPSTANRRRP